MTARTKQRRRTSRRTPHITRVVTEAVRQALSSLGDEAVQRVSTRGGELAVGVARLVMELSLVSEKRVDKAVASHYAYPEGYRCNPIGEQIQALATMFDLDPAQALTHAKTLPEELPEGAEGWFAYVKPSALSPSYGETLERVLTLIGESRPLQRNGFDGAIVDQCVRQSKRTNAMLTQLTSRQKGDIIIIPAQLGLHHRGKSIRRAEETFTANEFGLTALIVGCIALTHPERFAWVGELDIDCAGDEYSPAADGQFGWSFYFSFDDGRLKFGLRCPSDAYGCYGSASGFLPVE